MRVSQLASNARPGLSAAVALATALAVFSAPLVASEHEASVRHVTCLEHGELIDAAPLTFAELNAPAHHHARNVFEERSETPAGRDDLHCGLSAWAHERSTSARVETPSLDAPAAPRSSARQPAPIPRAIALYRLAPKLSPPRA
jgi:hypothetical protein